MNDEHLADVTLKGDQLLYDKGAISKGQLDGAQDGEDDARADLIASTSQLRLLGVDKNHPGDTALLHLHDRAYVFAPLADGRFHRVAVIEGDTLPDSSIVIASGLVPGQQIVANALDLQNTADHQ